MSDQRIPKYRKHKATGQAVVTIAGRDFYLGNHGTAASKREYSRLIAEWLSGGHKAAAVELTVTELISAFWTHCKRYYRKHNEPTSEVEAFRTVLRIVRKLYGDIAVRDFSPLKLKACRQQMIDKGWCRTSVNKQTHRIRRMFRWGVEQELVPPDVIHGLQAVQGLRKGRTTAPETPPVLPVDEAEVEATLPHMPPVVQAMVRVQLATGCRAQEICQIRPMDIDRTGDVWLYRPESHKNEHRGHERIIPIGPVAQGIIMAYLDRDPGAYLFDPRESEQLRRIDQHRQRKTPLSYGNRPGTNRKKQPKRKPGNRYTTTTYRRAIERACEKAGIERWTPGRLRHTAATKIRREYGLEAAQVILGHSQIGTTQIYAERDLKKALEIAAKIG